MRTSASSVCTAARQRIDNGDPQLAGYLLVDLGKGQRHAAQRHTVRPVQIPALLCLLKRALGGNAGVPVNIQHGDIGGTDRGQAISQPAFLHQLLRGSQKLLQRRDNGEARPSMEHTT